MSVGQVFSFFAMPPGLGGLGIGKSPIGGGGGGDKQEMPQPVQAPLPAGPNIDETNAAASDMANKRRKVLASEGKSIYTSPLGVTGEANVVRKTLLGQ